MAEDNNPKNLFEKLKDVFQDNTTNVTVRNTIIAAYILFICGIIVSILFLFIAIGLSGTQKLKRNPINNETLDYQAAKSTIFGFQSSVPYSLIIIINGLVFYTLFVSFILTHVIKGGVSEDSPIRKFLLIALGTSSVAFLGLLVFNLRVQTYIDNKKKEGAVATTVAIQFIRFLVPIVFLLVLTGHMMVAYVGGDRPISDKYSMGRWILLGTVVVVLGCISAVYFSVESRMSIVLKRNTDFNAHVKGHIYKNTNFLLKLSKPQPNGLLMLQQVDEALSSLPDSLDTNEMAQALFTINVYIHIHKLGFESVHLNKATSLLRPLNLVAGNRFVMSDYMNFYGTHVKDYSNVLSQYLPAMKLYNANILANAKLYKTEIQPAIMKSSAWTSTMNNEANGLTSNQTIPEFITLAMCVLLIELAPIGLLYFLVRKRAVK